MKRVLTGMALVLLSGCSYFAAKPTVETLHYQCGTMPLTVTMLPAETSSQASFLLDGERHVLPQVVSASGAKYSDGTYTFWSKGNQAFVQRGERVIVDDCTLN
ncbi:membrane-bound inhibitor of C-type lysozyme|uniref:Membrane-bound inhibitor of C-type lysozyme n=1 Tax=Brenneria salicis ATCC 15712 = DSM 30166 TaxID=714314 RepID=A0A366I058_9GAMM|nr:MliC family protein [Brenneria salicis]NMN91874.1 membrane-bound inhibitor of C-type lysozyme [Brenneria salicis ATCC 15712 = DSM 30166]RBP58335.1 membrane-bound inhibitor of C-type lysozyme [Brenneria salicis ATCC 15712 = DSM 30166]RLM29339.1 lysozyme inhibitor [Brenneria salicis ATCC 15712 = DSM 30166]